MPRVVLVDDDASIRRLVELSLEGLPLELVSCASVAQARAALVAAPAALLITDLMMPGESGYDLLQWLAARPALRATARIVVFSAGIDAAARVRLAALGVWRELGKPVSVAALEACVCEALGWGSTGSAAVPAAPAATPAATGRAAEARHALVHQFGGDVTLYGAFRAQATAQFADDLAEAERLLAVHDHEALRRLAHSLKGVLALLGHEADGAVARALEQAAAAGDREACERTWLALRAVVIEVMSEVT